MIDILLNLKKDLVIKIYCLVLILISILFSRNFNQSIINITSVINIAFALVFLTKGFPVLEKRKIIFCLIFVILFLLMLPIWDLFNNIQINIFVKVLYAAIISISLFYLLYYLFSYCPKESSYILNKRDTIVFMALPIIVLIYILFSNYPGLMDLDFYYLYNGGISSWHTISFYLLVSFFRRLGCPFIIRIIYALLLIYAIYYSIKLLANITKSKKAIIIYLCLMFLLNIVYFEQLQFFWKDILFSILFYIFILCILDLLSCSKKSLFLYIKLFLFGCMSSLFRHGGIIIPLIGFLLLIIINKKGRKIWILYLIISLAINIFINNILAFNILKAPKLPKYIPYAVPIQMLASIVNDDVILTNDEKNYLETYLPISEWKNNYDKYNSDTIAKDINPKLPIPKLEEFSNYKIILYNFHFLLKYPTIYLSNFFEYTNLLWKFNNNTVWECFDNSKAGLIIIDNKIVLSDNLDVNVESNIINKINELILEKNPFGRLLVRNALPLYLILVSLGILIYKKKVKIWVPFIILIVWLLGLFLSIPFPFTRYILIFIDSYIFLFVLSIYIQSDIVKM